LLDRVYIGYNFTAIASVIDAALGFVDWKFAVVIFACLYNKIKNQK